ncbi:hypothetical protein SBRCBS47491_008992 [Sporothrix bragantina]|uniref:Uncharacterized protein n=1 Tax=Sporothrix bragantina TaxID=671064 RepID=A0ABP0CTE2_9PEZI
MTTCTHTNAPTSQTAPAEAGAPSSFTAGGHRRNSSIVSSASSNPSSVSPLGSPTSLRQDPLAAFESALLAHPTTHRYCHRRHSQNSGNHLAPPSPASFTRGGRGSARSPSPSGRSPSHSPSPSPAARRCMEATAAWRPSMDRRQSWDDQDHRRAMMLQSTGLACPCHPQHEPGQSPSPTHGLGFGRRRHHRRQTAPHSGPAKSRSIYESDRGFSEVMGSGQ